MTNATDASRNSAETVDAGPNTSAPAAASPAPSRRRRHGWRLFMWSWLALITLLAGLLSGLWIWTGSEGSLATALRLAGARAPLVTDEVRGNLRSSGRVGRLVWEEGGLRIEVHDAEIRWTPAALLTRTLQIDHLGASRIVVDDQRPPSEEPSAGPPASVALPIRLQVKELVAGELRWAGPPPYTMQDIAGHFDYDGTRHLLELDRARVEGGHYHARAQITAHAPISLELALAGALTAPVPGAENPLPLSLQATLRGPLTELHAQAELQAMPTRTDAPALPPLPGITATAPGAPASALPTLPTPPAASSTTGDDDIPEAHLTARITPWAAQPLPEAHARLRAVDVGALWAEAPRTRLSGQLDVTPLPADGEAGWSVLAELSNHHAGPWDQRRLPVEQLHADVTWQSQVATVRALKAQVGGGTVESTGRWAAPAGTPGTAPPANPPAAATGQWQIDTRISGVNPARLHTRMAAFPVDGTAKVSGVGSAIDFDASLQARGQRADAPARSGESTAQALARDLRALALRDALATGRWDTGLLTLKRLRVRTDDAELAGSASVRPATPGGSADLVFTAPGSRITVKGEAQPGTGAGSLRAEIDDAARLLAWAKKLPGADQALADLGASGRATLVGDWRGGWRDPALQARLSAPSLDLRLPGAEADAAPIQARGVELALDGRLADARITANGRVTQGERQLDLRLAASGGRSTPKATLAASDWRATVSQLQAGLRDPALGAGVWQLASRTPVPLSWSPARGGQFEAGAGELGITSPAPSSQALVAWGPVRWRAGELSTTGRITGLPLQWAERVAGAQLADAGLTGDVVFNGDWDATLGDTLRVTANLARASGDLTILTNDAQTGVQSRVPAGLREARLTLRSQGQALQLQLKWDSAQAGSVDGQLRTELAASRTEDGGTQWSWPESAPLQGQLQARLPQISAWSVLAPPGWRLRGALAADTRIGGTRGTPRVEGTLSADDLALRSVVDGIEFADGRLRARLDGTRLLIDEFTLRGAGEQGGRLRASGEAGWIDGRAQARLNASLEQLRASIRADRQVTVSGQVQATLDNRAVRADGQLRVDRALIVLPDENAPRLGDDVIVRGADGKIMYGSQAPGTVAHPTSAAGQQDAAQAKRAEARRTRADAQAAQGDGTPLSIAAKVQVDLGEDFRLRGMGIDTRLAGVLTLTADGPASAMPRLTGTVRTVGGTFRAYGQQLIIERGNIIFRGPIDNPTLDIIALRPNYTSDQRVGAQVMGTALLPRVRLYSEPALPDNQTLAWLLLGRPAPNTGAEAAMLQSAALALLGGREGRGLAQSFGLDELSFSGGGDGEFADASVTLGKRLSDRLYAAYEHSLSGASGTLLIFYELSRRWTLRGQAGENAAIDLIFRLSFD